MRYFTLSSALIVAGFMLGIGSAIHGLDAWGLKAVTDAPSWQEWRLNQSDKMQIYALGHFLGQGQLPPSRSSRYFSRRVDDEGNLLRSGCSYVLKSTPILARWWSIDVGTSDVQIAPSEISAGQALLAFDGSFNITIARGPHPGNWLVPPDSSAIIVNLSLSEPEIGKAFILPSISKAGCT